MAHRKRPLVVVTRKLPDSIETRMRELFDTRLNLDDKPMSAAELADTVKNADVLVPTVTDRIDASVLSKAGDKLKLIANYGNGVDHIDVATALSRGITVTNTPGVLTEDTADMLAVGRARAAERGLDDAITFIEGNAEALPLADHSYDAVTIAFGIRNVPRIEAALREAYRVLRIGGRFLCLEFSTVDVPGLDVFYDFYSFNVIPVLGRTVVGDAEAYRYLVESIRRFPPPHAFCAALARINVEDLAH